MVNETSGAASIPSLDHWSGSWIISDRITGQAVAEFYERATVERINTLRYRVETAYEYLTRLNRELAATR